MRISLSLVLLALLASAALFITRANADPGSKEDPLATVGYVQKKAQFTRRSLPAGSSIKLGVAAEMVVVDPPSGSLRAGQLDGLRDTLVDLSDGSLAENGTIETLHHYINGSSHEIFLSFDREVTVLLRGEWK
jgi:hypothetical protein